MSDRRSSGLKGFSEVFEAHGLQQLGLAPTNQSSVLDLLLRNRIGLVSEVERGPSSGSSDHAKVTLSLGLILKWRTQCGFKTSRVLIIA